MEGVKQSETKSAKRSHPTSKARSAGFLKSKRKVKRKGRQNKMLWGGVCKTVEKSGVTTCTTANQVYYIGHVTTPYDETLRMVARAIIKRLFDKIGYPVKNFLDTLTWSTAGDRIDIRWQGATDSAITTSNITFGAAETAETISTALAALAPFISASDDRRLIDIALYPYVAATPVSGSTSGKLNLDNAKIEIWSKSSLKVQNRSVGVSTNVEEDAVDNVPLYGKSYTGKGTGTEYSRTPTSAATPFFADTGAGLITNVGSAANGTLEPPFGQLFKRVKTTGRVRIEPGEIKTSVLTYKKKISLNALLQLASYAGETYPAFRFGNFRFMALEKIMNADTALDFKYAYENNTLLQCRLYEGKQNNYTTMLFGT